jgi:hypothetical protein
VPGRGFHGFPDLRVVAEDLDHRPAHAIGEAHARVWRAARFEGDDTLRVGGDEARHEPVQDGLNEPAALLHPGQRRLEMRVRSAANSSRSVR